MASGAVNTAGQVGLAVAIAVYGSIFTTHITRALSGVGHGTAARVAGGGAAAVVARAPAAQRPALETAIHAAVASALGETFLAAGIVGIAGAALSLVLLHRPRRADAQVRERAEAA